VKLLAFGLALGASRSGGVLGERSESASALNSSKLASALNPCGQRPQAGGPPGQIAGIAGSVHCLRPEAPQRKEPMETQNVAKEGEKAAEPWLRAQLLGPGHFAFTPAPAPPRPPAPIGPSGDVLT